MLATDQYLAEQLPPLKPIRFQFNHYNATHEHAALSFWLTPHCYYPAALIFQQPEINHEEALLLALGTLLRPFAERPDFPAHQHGSRWQRVGRSARY